MSGRVKRLCGGRDIAPSNGARLVITSSGCPKDEVRPAMTYATNGALYWRNMATTESRNGLQSRNFDVHGKDELLIFLLINFNAI